MMKLAVVVSKSFSILYLQNDTKGYEITVFQGFTAAHKESSQFTPYNQHYNSSLYHCIGLRPLWRSGQVTI